LPLAGMAGASVTSASHLNNSFINFLLNSN
jgi:hypothetical protein